MPTVNTPRPKKHLGQNFLQDQNLLAKIVRYADLKPGEPVLEIGPGTGNLTEHLAAPGAQVLGLDSDPDVLAVATERFKNLSNVELRHQNVMKMDWCALIKEFAASNGAWAGQRPAPTNTIISVVANIPYYITSPILEKLAEVKDLLRQAVIMMQQEVGERLLAEPGTKAYGSLSVFLNYHFQIEKAFEVPRECFVPRPNVDSVVLRFVPCRRRDTGPRAPTDVDSEQMLFALIRTAFWSRRKTFVNCIKSGPFIKAHLRPKVLEVYATMGWDARRRGETLTLGEFMGFAQALTSSS